MRENNKNIYYIYGLSSTKKFKDIRYIGKTNNIKARLRRHIFDSKNKSSYKECWIYGILKRSKEPNILIIEKVTGENVSKQEKYWIKVYKDKGYKLTNHTDGGEHYKMSENTKKKISKANTGRKLSKETIEKHRKFMLSDKNTKRGKPFSKNHKFKLRLSKLGKNNPMFGKKTSNQTIKKLSLKLKGKPKNQLHRFKIAQAQFSKKKKIIQYNLQDIPIKIWDSAKDITNTLKIHRSNIIACCKNRLKTTGGYKWKYLI